MANTSVGVRQSHERRVLNGRDAPSPVTDWPPPALRPKASKNGRLQTFRGGRWVQVAYVLIDLCFVCVNSIAAFSLRFWPAYNVGFFEFLRSGRSAGLPEYHYSAFLLLYAALVLLFCEWQGLYRTPRDRTALIESFAVLKAVLLATVLLSAFVYLSGITIVSRLVVVCSGILNVVTLIAWRLWKRRFVLRRAAEGIGARNAVIIGAGRIGQALAQQIEGNKLLGYHFTGFLDANHSTHPKLLGKVDDLARVARTQFVDEVFITIPSERELVKKVAVQARLHHLNVKVVPELYDGLGWTAPIGYVGEFPVMELHGEPIPAFGLFVKRLIDLLASITLLVLLAPLVALIAAIIKIDSSGPALYLSMRVGRKGREFVCYKFRTMVVNADAVKDQIRHLNEREGPFFKITNDPRITRVGGFLRRFSLDELPQLWNVLKGDMSLVGPRPHPLDDYAQYDLEHMRRLDVRPGITGLWQVTARKHPSFDTNMQLDLEYIENWNLWLDLKILSSTLPVVLSGSGS